MNKGKLLNLIRGLSVERKCALLTGDGAFAAKGLPEAGIKGFRLSDGPSGVRDGNETVCYPSADLIACSFDRETAKAIGEMLGEDCKKRRIGLLLGPAQNLKRTPVCGRNFEYYSEDPCLSGELAGAFVCGLQKYVGACVKHFAANNQEDLRMTVDCVIDKKTLQEIYLSSFERIIRKSSPYSIMSSYNKINGEYVGENKYVANKVLRNDWNYKGLMVSDWGAVDDIVKAFLCGLGLEMPKNPSNAKKLADAVKRGEVSEEQLDERVVQYLEFAQKINEKLDGDDVSENRRSELGRLTAESFVLLKNKNDILPIGRDKKKIGVFGEFARKPRIQGGGCANVSAMSSAEPLECLRDKFKDSEIVYSKAFDVFGNTDPVAEKEALDLATRCDVCIVFLGLPEKLESEGYDRESLDMPEGETEFLRKLYDVNKEVVVMLMNGGTVTMAWDKYCKALVECYLAGSAFGEASAAVLYGDVSPCGRLPETVLNSLSDSSAFPFFEHGKNVCRYNEGLFVGYKYYISKRVKVKYPFGYGLSYGKVDYRNVKIDGRSVRFTLVSKCDRAVKETVQIYVGYKGDNCVRPLRELKFFDKVTVPPHGSVDYSTYLDDDCFYVYDEKLDALKIGIGEFEITVAKNCEKIIYSSVISVRNGEHPVYDRNSRIGEFAKTKNGVRIIENVLRPYLCKAIIGNFNAEIIMENGKAKDMPMFNNVTENMPLRMLINLTAGAFSEEKLNQVLAELNDSSFADD